MSDVKKLYFSSKSLYEHLKQELPPGEDDRDTYIEKVNELLQKREMQISQAMNNRIELSDTEKKIAAEIVKMNNHINSRLEEMKNLIGKEIKEVKIKKAQGQKYENPYDGPVDGYFFDKKGV